MAAVTLAMATLTSTGALGMRTNKEMGPGELLDEPYRGIEGYAGCQSSYSYVIYQLCQVNITD